MTALRTLLAVLLCSAAVRAQAVDAVVDRPLTLPKGRLDVTLHGTYTNWSAGGATADGLSLEMGFDFGASDKTQGGIALALPITPGAGFGSILGTAVYGASPNLGIRLDAGYERIGFNGGSGFLTGHANRFFGGLGVPIRVPITPMVAFVSGRTSSVQFGHFNNFGDSGVGFYSGASSFPESSSDFFVISGGDSSTTTNVGIHLPLGLLLQPEPHLALRLESGYAALINDSGTLHFIPLAVEAIVTPVPRLDFGLRFVVDGNVAGSSAFGYFDQRALMFWLRLRA
jgi:opacity protein-like surface antigen